MEGQQTGIALIVVGTTQPNPLPTTTKELGERERDPLEFLKVKRNNAKSFRNMLYRIKIIATKDYVSTICFAKKKRRPYFEVFLEIHDHKCSF